MTVPLWQEKQDSITSLPVIVLMDASIALTGAFICARNIARALEGRARVILVLPDNSSIGSEDTIPFAAVHRIPIRPLRRSAGAVLGYLPMLFWASLRLRCLLRRERAVALLINDFYMMQGAFCRFFGYHGLMITWVRINPAAFGKLLSGVWLRVAAAVSNQLVTVSRHTRACLPSDIKTYLLYDALNPLPPKVTSAGNEPRFVYVGNYIPGKGQDMAIEAFAPIAAEFPMASLHFHGGDMGLPRNRAFRDKLVKRIAELGLKKQVFLHDFAPDPFQTLQSARAAVNFSASETFSMTVLEAQGVGLPVISTRCGGPQEIIAEGETGLLVDIGNIPAMTDAIRILAGDSALAARMGLAARARVKQNFSPPVFLASLLEILSSIIQCELNEPSLDHS